MHPIAAPAELTVTRRVFSAWSIDLPMSFSEAPLEGGDGWHGYDAYRSVSLTSVVLTDRHRPVPADAIARVLLPLEGEAVPTCPPGLAGQAVYGEAIQPARASRTLSGVLVAHGRMLVVTITSDDLDWARRVWLSIRHHRAGFGSIHEGRAAKVKKRRR